MDPVTKGLNNDSFKAGLLRTFRKHQESFPNIQFEGAPTDSMEILKMSFSPSHFGTHGPGIYLLFSFNDHLWLDFNGENDREPWQVEHHYLYQFKKDVSRAVVDELIESGKIYYRSDMPEEVLEGVGEKQSAVDLHLCGRRNSDELREDSGVSRDPEESQDVQENEHQDSAAQHKL